MSAVTTWRRALADLIDDVLPGRVHDHEPDVLVPPVIWLGRPELTGTGTAAGPGPLQVSLPVTIVVDGVGRAAQDRVDQLVERLVVAIATIAAAERITPTVVDDRWAAVVELTTHILPEASP